MFVVDVSDMNIVVLSGLVESVWNFGVFIDPVAMLLIVAFRS